MTIRDTLIAARALIASPDNFSREWSFANADDTPLEDQDISTAIRRSVSGAVFAVSGAVLPFPGDAGFDAGIDALGFLLIGIPQTEKTTQAAIAWTINKLSGRNALEIEVLGFINSWVQGDLPSHSEILALFDRAIDAGTSDPGEYAEILAAQAKEGARA